MNIPDKLYHATFKHNALNIICEGLKPGCEHLTYFADTPQGAATFLYFRALTTSEKYIMCLEISTENLDKSLIKEGTDHSPEFFKGIQVFTYPDFISPENISDLYIGYDLTKIIA
jgi:hypothetical protein